MNGGFFDKKKLPDKFRLTMYLSKKKDYVYHLGNVLSQFNKNNGIKKIYKNVSVPVQTLLRK